MPRIAAHRKRYMLSDFSKWVKDRMFELGISQTVAGKWLGISQQEFSRKLNNNLFKMDDGFTLLNKLEASEKEILKLVKM